MGMGLAHHFAALIKVAKSLALLNVIEHGKVPYQKPQLSIGFNLN